VIIDTNPEKLTHYLNSVILNACSEHRVKAAADHVEEILVFIGKDNTVKHVITFLKIDEVRTKYSDFFENEPSEKDLIIMLNQSLEIAQWCLEKNIAYPSFDS